MFKHSFRSSVVILTTVLFSGCSWFMEEDTTTQDEYDYTQARMTKSLTVPTDVGQSNEQDLFLVPDLPPETRGRIYGPDGEVMPPMQVLTLGNKVRVDRSSEITSAFIRERQIQLWDMLERFLIEKNIPVVSKDLASGSILTGWQLEEDDSFFTGPIEAWRYRYQLKLASAERPSENLVSVVVLEAQEKPDDGDWRNLIPDGRKETELLNSFLGYMHVEDIAQSRERVSQSALGGITLSLGNDNNGNAALISSASFDQVWTRIPLSLEALNFSIDDQDRSQGLYFVTYEGPDSGFFDALAFWSDSDVEELELDEDSYRIQVSEEGERVIMTWLDDEGEVLSPEILARNFATLSKAFKARIGN